MAVERVLISAVVAPACCHRPAHGARGCALVAVPCPWVAVPQLVPLQVRNGTLSIAAVERASAGTYTCHASSKEGTVTHTTRVLVQGKDGTSPSPAP